MTTPRQHLEIFDKGLEDVYYESREYTIKQHLIQTVINVLENEISEIDKHLKAVSWLGYEKGCEHVRNSLTATLSSWKALLE